jgi:hypothetical protein
MSGRAKGRNRSIVLPLVFMKLESLYFEGKNLLHKRDKGDEGDKTQKKTETLFFVLKPEIMFGFCSYPLCPLHPCYRCLSLSFSEP